MTTPKKFAWCVYIIQKQEHNAARRERSSSSEYTSHVLCLPRANCWKLCNRSAFALLFFFIIRGQKAASTLVLLMIVQWMAHVQRVIFWCSQKSNYSFDAYYLFGWHVKNPVDFLVPNFNFCAVATMWPRMHSELISAQNILYSFPENCYGPSSKFVYSSFQLCGWLHDARWEIREIHLKFQWWCTSPWLITRCASIPKNKHVVRVQSAAFFLQKLKTMENWYVTRHWDADALYSSTDYDLFSPLLIMLLLQDSKMDFECCAKKKKRLFRASLISSIQLNAIIRRSFSYSAQVSQSLYTVQWRVSSV